MADADGDTASASAEHHLNGLNGNNPASAASASTRSDFLLKEDDIPEFPPDPQYESASTVNQTIKNDSAVNNRSDSWKRTFPFNDGPEAEFLGFEAESEEIRLRNVSGLSSAIERLERELAAACSTDNIHIKVNKRARTASPVLASSDTVSSRPSSGMSIRSDSDLSVHINETVSPGAGGGRASVGRKMKIDLSNIMYRAPMEVGWKRELVYRAGSDQNMKRQADVYYYTPVGKKLRSTREVSEHIIGTDLTVENFTFFKEPLGIEDQEKEIIREAKVIRNRPDPSQPGADRLEGDDSGVEGKRASKPKTPKGTSPDPLFNLGGKSKTLKIKSVGSRLSMGSPGRNLSSPTPKTPPTPEPGKTPPKSSIRKSVDSQWKKPTQELEESLERLKPTFNIAEKFNSPEKVVFIGLSAELVPQQPQQQQQQQPLQLQQAPMNPQRIFPSVVSDFARVQPAIAQPKKFPSPTPVVAQISNPIGNQIGNQMQNQMVGGGRDMCPMRCPLANKEPPTLQCSLCLCLYHSQCTGFLPNTNTSYVCKNCHLSNSGMPPTLVNPTPHLTPMKLPPKGLPGVVISTPASLPRFSKPLPIVNRVPQPRITPIVNQVPVKQKSFHQPGFKQSPKNPKNSPEKNKAFIGSPSPWQATAEKPHDQTIKSEVDMSIFPQSIAILNGHKFIVVPKPNTQVTSPQITNPKQADSAPKIVDTTLASASSMASVLKLPIKLPDELKDEPKLQYKALPKCDNFNNTNVISFDNLSIEYGKIFKAENIGSGPEGGAMKRTFIADIDDGTPGNKRKSKGPPIPKITPKVMKRSENGTAAQKVGVRGQKPADTKNKNYFAEFYRINSERDYNSLVQIFQYLKMRELAAAARVCRMWREIADTPALWKSVRMKNSQVNDWEGLAAALKRHGTRHLDLRKMLHKNPPEVPDKVWDEFVEHISTVDTLVKIDLCRCPAIVVEQVCERMPQLQVLTATSVRCVNLNPAPLAALTNLQELRIKGMTGLTLTSDLQCLENLTKLKHLSITSVKDLGKHKCVVIGKLVNLESLELGECVEDVGGPELLKNLINLTRLRLERCPGANGGAILLRAASGLPLLRQLELINFDIKPGFEEALSKCTNVKRLLIIPTYVSQSATTNRCVLAGVLSLENSLTHLVWGVTMELLKVTELFIDQCDRNQAQPGATPDAKTSPPKPVKRKPGGVGDCIPVLKPVPGLPAEEVRMADMAGRPQVEILPLPALQRLLAAELPNTRLKLLRIPYHHTWRQTFNDFD